MKKKFNKDNVSNIKTKFKNKTEELFDNTSSNFEQFKQFMFAPFLLTFVISIVIGYSFSDVIKSLTNFIARFIGYIWSWIFDFNGSHPTASLLSSLSSIVQDSLTLVFISYIVFYLIKTINKYLKKNKSQQWGYDQAHEDALLMQELQEKNNNLIQENIKLQKELLAELRKNK
ncbi:MscL family protein [Fructobacillus sp. M158]|uniref:MscL family protein n=1 Tax=Fructobacillus parabroussonetiae TaxID=2713174 RepID=UPI00200A6DD6|nr:MscL family protein [Fructobacillus parabroussonetiae]MCK8617333.1 MscL family protein [Fructobacillus parabroussonetiae]